MNEETLGALFGFAATFLYVLAGIACVNLIFLFFRKKKPTSEDVAKTVGASASRLVFYCFEFLIGCGILLFLLRAMPKIVGIFFSDFATVHTAGFILGLLFGWAGFILFRKTRILIFEKSPTSTLAWSIYLTVSIVLIYLLYFFKGFAATR